MHRFAIALLALLTVLTSCAGSELSDAISSDFEGWSRVSVESAVDVVVTDGNDSPVAYVAVQKWDSDDRITTPGTECPVDCDGMVATLMEQHREEFPNHQNPYPSEAALARDFCNGCDSRLLLAVLPNETDDGGYRFGTRDEVLDLIQPIDTSFEAMLATGSATRVRLVDGTWRAVVSDLISDCSPIIRRTSLLEIADDGSTTEVDFIDKNEGDDCDY